MHAADHEATSALVQSEGGGRIGSKENRGTEDCQTKRHYPPFVEQAPVAQVDRPQEVHERATQVHRPQEVHGTQQEVIPPELTS